MNIVSQRAVLAPRQGSQDCIKHTIKILRNCFSKESQHNPGSLEFQAPRICGLWKVVRVMRVVIGEQPSSKPSSHLHLDTFTYVCQCGDGLMALKMAVLR